MNKENAAIEDGCDSSRDEILSASSYNISNANLDLAFGSSLSLTSHAPKPSNKDTSLLSGECFSVSSYGAVPQLSAAEVLHKPTGDEILFLRLLLSS